MDSFQVDTNTILCMKESFNGEASNSTLTLTWSISANNTERCSQEKETLTVPTTLLKKPSTRQENISVEPDNPIPIY